MKEFQKCFKKVVYGYASVQADSLEEAEKLFEEEGDTYDEFDNKSEYEWEEKITEVE